MVTHEDIFLNKCEDLWAWSGGGSQLCGDGRDSRPHSFFDPRFNRRLTDDLPLTQRIHCGRSHLPTFSSPAIEAHLHRIPGLSPKVRIMRTRASRCHARTHTHTHTHAVRAPTLLPSSYPAFHPRSSFTSTTTCCLETRCGRQTSTPTLAARRSTLPGRSPTATKAAPPRGSTTVSAIRFAVCDCECVALDSVCVRHAMESRCCERYADGTPLLCDTRGGLPFSWRFRLAMSPRATTTESIASM